MVIMEIILTLIVYIMQMGTVIIVAGIPSILLYKLKKKIRISIVLFLSTLIMEIMGILFISNHPLLICPEKYQIFLSEERQQEIINLNTGVYSYKIPVFPVCIAVEYADNNSAIVRTYYMVFGQTEMYIGNNDIETSGLS